MEEHAGMLTTPRYGNVQISNIMSVQRAFLLRHLCPLPVMPLRRMHAAKSFHRKKELQFEMGYPPCRGLAL